MSQIAGKSIIITGASSGIGEATARMLADRGAKLMLAARRQERLDQQSHWLEVLRSRPFLELNHALTDSIVDSIRLVKLPIAYCAQV